MSMSGIDTRSGFRKRSKIRLKSSGSTSVMRSAIRDQAPGRRSAARPDRNPLLARVADEVPDDQEVPGYFIFLIISTS